MEPTQDINQPNEAGFSVNMFLHHPAMGKTQFTFRGATSRDWGSVLEDIDNFLRYMRDKGWHFDGQRPANGDGQPAAKPQQPEPPQPQDPGEPRYTPVDDTGYETPPVKSFVVEKLSVRMEDGKFFYKAMGGNYTQYGISVWPEVLQEAGLPTDTPTMPSINGWTAEYIEQQKDGKTRRKVTRLIRP